MLNTLTKFERFKQEHEAIRANLKQIASSTDNLLTLSRLQDSSAQFTPYQINILSDRRLNLKRNLAILKDGIMEHHQREEEALASLIGETLMQIICREHRRAVEILAEIDWILLNVGPLGILFNISFLKQKVDILDRILKAICIREDSVLDLLKKMPEN